MSTNSLDIEESFFSACSFIVYNNIHHNLHNWHIKLDNWENKFCISFASITNN